MAISIRCGNCGAKLKAKESGLGQVRPCPICKTPITVKYEINPTNVFDSSDNSNVDTSCNVSNTKNKSTSTIEVSSKLKMFSKLKVALLTVPTALVLGFACYGVTVMFSNKEIDPPKINQDQLAMANLSPQTDDTTNNKLSNSKVEEVAELRAREIVAQEMARQQELVRQETIKRKKEIEEQEAIHQAEQNRLMLVQRNANAWKQMRMCDNRNERLSRESQLEYWESMRQDYGEIDTQGVDFEFVELLENYRTLFLEYANTHRMWAKEREPLVNALNSAKSPETFAEGLVIGFAGGVGIKMIEEIDSKYQSQLAGMKLKLDELQTREKNLRLEMTKKYGAEM